jgi:ABC-type iron transport system FetAB ATPase subunit
VLFEEASVSLADGQCVTLEGPSGSGKSTLLLHVTALAYSSQARRRLGGAEYAGAELPGWRARVTLVAQDAPMITGSVGDNLDFPFAQRAGSDRGFDEEGARRLLTAVELGRLPLDREIRTLSGGERCFELLLRYARRPGRLLLCALHDPKLNALADRRLRLADGGLEETG